MPGDHLKIVKAAKANDASLGVVIDFIRGEDNSRWRWGTAALALERRDFHGVERQLGPTREKLDRRALVDLALALDGLGKRKEAMEVLDDAKRHGTDAMGVLAGRHKRNWIRYRVEKEVQSAINLYREAYELSVDKNNAAQAFYHGINLAFLALVYEEDRPKALGLADSVLGHCADAQKNEHPGDRMWRLATEGEAYLILGNIDTALERYKQSFEGLPKPEPWQFTSTSQQALRVADEPGYEKMAQDLLKIFTGDKQ